MADNQTIFYDVLPEQIGLRKGDDINPANLRKAGFDQVGKDTDSVEGGKIHLWKGEGNRWILILKYGVGNKIIGSALVFSSEQLSNVITRFQKIMEVL